MLKKWGWTLVLCILVFSSCDMLYRTFYRELTLSIVNGTAEDISEITIMKRSIIERYDTSILAASLSREYILDERTSYVVSGILDGGATFSETADFSNKEEIEIRVK